MAAVRIPIGRVSVEGDLVIPENAAGAVLFAHGSGSSRHSPRNRFVAAALQKAGFATLLMDLLTADEEIEDEQTARLRFDIELLGERLLAAVDWLPRQPSVGDMPIGCFGASTGAAAALVAAAERPDAVSVVVSRGGRPDLAKSALGRVRAATLLIVGAEDHAVVSMNQAALTQLTATRTKDLVLVPRATHLFSEPGTLEEMTGIASRWFEQHIPAPVTGARSSSK